jgi:hypothetical protein
VHVLNSKTRTWTELTGALQGAGDAEVPAPRSDMGFATGLEAGIWMFGGIGKAGQSSVYHTQQHALG